MPASDESLERLRGAIEELARADLDELLSEARAEARARVRTMLSDALAHAMLERVEERFGLPAPPVRETAPPVRETAPPVRETAGAVREAAAVVPEALPGDELVWYVYGVVAADAANPPALRGVDGSHPVRTLREGALAAIVSLVAFEDFGEAQLRAHLADMDWVERTARAHEEALEQIRNAATVIPMRMCTVYRTEGGVREMLRRESGALVEALAHLDGKTEWGVKVFAARDGAPPAAARQQSEPPPTGTAYMEGRLRQRDEAQRSARRVEEAIARIHERLCHVAADGLLSPPQRPEATGRDAEMLLNGVYLVDDEEQDAFDDEVRALEAEFSSLALTLELTGPWPPYNFVPGTIGAAW